MTDQNRPCRPELAAANRKPSAGATASRVLRQFRQVFNAVKTHFQQVEKTAGIGGAQLWALSVIQAQPGIGVKGLAQAMDIHQTTASNLGKALIRGELASAERKGSDRRALELRVLAAGSAVLRKAPGPFAGILPQALNRLDSATLDFLERDLAILIRELNAHAAAGKIPLAPL